MNHPLLEWKSENVKNLLLDFYVANFTDAKVAEEIPRQIISIPWSNRKPELEQELYREMAKLYDLARKQADNPVDEIDPIELFSEDYKAIYSFLDVGANKLDLINLLSDKYKNIKKLIGIDIIPQREEFRNPDRSEYYQVDEAATEFPIEDNSIDMINIQFVLHHFPDEKAIRNMMESCSRALKNGGSIIIWEESFKRVQRIDDRLLTELVKNNNEIGIQTDLDLTQRFYELSVEQRWEFIIANDWLINVRNPHMPWTGQYRLWEEWIALLGEYSFELEKEWELGLRRNRKLKQGVWMIGKFKRI